MRKNPVRLLRPATLAFSVLVSLPRPSAAAPDDVKELSAQAPTRPSDMPLSLLPEPPPLELPAPRPASLEAIDDLLARLVHADANVRDGAARELLEVKPDWVSGLSRRIDRIAERADKGAMRLLLEKLRERAKKKRSKEEREEGVESLGVVLENAAPDSAVWRDLAQTLAVSRMLKNIGSAESVRELIRVYVRFGEFMRIDTQLQLEALGERSIAGLIEAKRHQAPKISSWAQKRLDLLGKSIPHEAVRTKDPAALAEILVALGRTRDPDAARVLISFASTERSQVRTAARQGIALLGDVSAWQLRDAYLDTTGKQAPRDWTWKRTARELFTEYDRLRLAKVFELFEESKKAAEAGDWAKMRDGYDQVLALSPLFEQREQMAAGYMKFALDKEASEPEVAISALRRVERLSDKEEDRRRAESLRHVLEARRLRDGGIVDRGLIDKAIALDPESDFAEDELGRTAASSTGLPARTRYLLAGAVALVSVGGVGWLGFSTWRRRRLDDAGEAADEFDESEDDSNELDDGASKATDGSNESGDDANDSNAATDDAGNATDNSNESGDVANDSNAATDDASAATDNPPSNDVVTNESNDGTTSSDVDARSNDESPSPESRSNDAPRGESQSNDDASEPPTRDEK